MFTDETTWEKPECIDAAQTALGVLSYSPPKEEGPPGANLYVLHRTILGFIGVVDLRSEPLLQRQESAN